MESQDRIQSAVNDLWAYTDELFHMTAADKAMAAENIGADVSKLKEAYYKKVGEILEESTLKTPELIYFQKGGKQGVHSEHMGFLLADLQYMQRTFPNMSW